MPTLSRDSPGLFKTLPSGAYVDLAHGWSSVPLLGKVSCPAFW